MRKKLFLLVMCSLMLVGCSVDKYGIHLSVPDTENAMDIRANASYTSEPEVITDDVVASIYDIDFHTATTVQLTEDVADYSDTIFYDVTSNPKSNACISNLIDYFDKSNIDYKKGFVVNTSSYTDYMCNVTVCVDNIFYTGVIAITEDLEPGQAKFAVKKKAVDEEPST